jgi:hypothetical protein
MKKFINSIFNNSFFSPEASKSSGRKIGNSIRLGIKKGLEIPTLPLQIRKFYDHILVRTVRFIGGLCVILNLTKLYLTFPEITHYFILLMSVLHIIQVLIILLIKIIYSIYTLIYKPEVFEVRNSPINFFATHLSKIILCAKIGCGVTGGAAGVVAAGATFDTLLDEAGYKKIFVPFIAEGVKSVFGNSISPKVTELLEKTSGEQSLSKETIEERQSNIKSKIDSYNNLDPAGKTDFWSEIAKDINKK